MATALDQIEHIVVLMLENRSFDHMLGYLSREGGRADVDGLPIRDLPFNEFRGVRYVPGALGTTAIPYDPCHERHCTVEQLANGNRGYVRSFARINPPPAEADFGVVMGYYRAIDVPAFDFLAEQYCVCDRWYSSVVGSTTPNRMYSLAGESNGDFDTPRRPPPAYDMKTVFEFLTEAGVSWNFYAGDFLANNLWFTKYYQLGRPIKRLAEFFEDAKSGSLPSVSWIDPHFGIIPGSGGDQNDDHPPVDIRRGQKLVAELYKALVRESAWARTMFVITYDEHGGFFDHAYTPEVPGPAQDHRPDFREYGPRVPALVASPFVEPRSVSHTVLDHTSLPRTILARFCRGADGTIPAMTERVDNANDLGGVLTRAEARMDRPLPPAVDGPPLTHTLAALEDFVGPPPELDSPYHRALAQMRTDLQNKPLRDER